MKKRACVVGAGPSGLVMIKELLEAGVEVKCFESYDSIGGAFRSIEKGGRSYDSLQLTVSNYFMSYSDFMPEKGADRRYWSVSEYRDYLFDYIAHFNLSEHIFLSHTVTASHIEGEKVIVEVSHDSKKTTEIFDHLIICTGSNFVPKQPDLPNQNSFKGEVFHSSQYINADQFKGKNVLCIGLGESGADVVHEISEVAESCRLLVRDYPNIIPRWINGHTNDSYTSTCFYNMKKTGIDKYMKFKAWYYLKYNKDLDESGKLIQEWVASRKSFMGKFFTKTDVFVKDVVEGRVEVTKDTAVSFDESGMKTESNGIIEADVVMFNTGYQTNFSEYEFGSSFENPRVLYKHMIHPEFGERIGLVGWARPSQGGLPACSEMQARYMAKLVSNELQLPSKEQMKKTIMKDTSYYERLFEDSIYIKSLICYHRFMNDMGQILNCKPKLVHLGDFSLTRKLIFGSHIPAIYRLKENKRSKKVIKSLPIAYSPRRTAVLFLFTFLFYPSYLMRGV